MPQAPTVALPKRLPLVVEPENRDDSTLKDAKLVNGYIEHNEKTDEYWLFKRPGLLLSSRPPAANVTGWGVFNWKGDIYSIFDVKVYKNGTDMTSNLAHIPQGVMRFASTLGASPKMVMMDGRYAYYSDGTTNTQITDADFPTTLLVKGWAYLDGCLYVMNSSAAIFNSAANDPSTWPGDNLIAQIEPDGGVALAKQLVYVITLKQWTTEVFYDAANAAGSPLGAVQGAKINYGCGSADSVQEMDGVLYWLATNRGAANQVIALDNLKPTIISTKAVERLLGYADLTTVYSFTIKYEGHRFYVLTIKNENITLVYDAAERMWAQWTDVDGNYFPIVSATYSSSAGVILQHETNGKLYLFNASYLTDDSSIITTDLYTPNFDGGVRRRKTLTMMEFVGDQVTGSTLQVRVNDNDYDSKSWSNFRKVDLSQKRPILTNCGTFVKRAHHLRHACNTKLRIQAIELQMDLGTL